MAYSAWLFRLWYTYIGYAELIVRKPGKLSAAECLFLLLQACCCHLFGPRSACTAGYAQRKRCIWRVSQAAENVHNTVALRPRCVITFQWTCAMDLHAAVLMLVAWQTVCSLVREHSATWNLQQNC